MDELMLDGNAVAGLLREVFTSTGAPASFSAAHTATTSSRRSSRVIRGSGSTPPESSLWKSASEVASVLIEMGATA